MEQELFDDLCTSIKQMHEIENRICPLCEREGVPALTKHHLIPQHRHNKRVKKQYGDECKTRVAWLCVACHRQVHYLFTNKELEKDFNTLEALKVHPDVAKYVQWIKNKPADFVPTKGRRKN